MRYLALAVDYDGTAASNDNLSDAAALAIERLRISGRRIVLVTGRRVADLLRVCPKIALFSAVGLATACAIVILIYAGLDRAQLTRAVPAWVEAEMAPVPPAWLHQLQRDPTLWIRCQAEFARSVPRALGGCRPPRTSTH